MSFLDQLQIFTHVAELCSFTQAADRLGLPKASVSVAVQQLENRLGARLFHRTTRRVTLTQDGAAFFERCRDTLSDLDELQNLFQAQSSQSLKGRVRIDMGTFIARNAVLPRLPELLAQHPHLSLEISSTERRVDVVREGFDCVIRAGAVVDAGLIARPLGAMPMVNCASPAYLERHGIPQTLEDLQHHQLIHYAPILGAKTSGFEYIAEETEQTIPMLGAITVNNADAYQVACLAGLGIIQAPRVGVREWLAQGQLHEILPAWQSRPMPITLLYANRRNLSVRVRFVMDWLAARVIDYLGLRSNEARGHWEVAQIRRDTKED